MKFEITKEKENPLFGRKEIQAYIEAQITPSKNEMINLIAQKFSTQPENISIKGIHGRFGSRNFLVNANIYSSKEEKEKTEPKSKKQKIQEKTKVPSEEGKTNEEVKKEESEKQELTQPDKEPTEQNTESKPEEKSE